jgi:hypothetical protein
MEYYIAISIQYQSSISGNVALKGEKKKLKAVCIVRHKKNLLLHLKNDA